MALSDTGHFGGSSLLAFRVRLSASCYPTVGCVFPSLVENLNINFGARIRRLSFWQRQREALRFGRQLHCSLIVGANEGARMMADVNGRLHVSTAGH